MKKKTVKIIAILAIVLCAVSFFSVCFADVSITNLANGVLNQDAENKLGSIGGNIAAFIRNVAIVVAVIMLMVIGIKYMVGSSEEKAEYKRVAIPYVIGAIICFAAAGIAQVIINMAQGV